MRKRVDYRMWCYRAARMLGRLANGCEADGGQLIHAVFKKPVPMRPCPANQWGRIPGMMVEAEVSFCGKRPGRRSVGWSSEADAEKFQDGITCDKCLRRLYRSGVGCHRHVPEIKGDFVVSGTTVAPDFYGEKK